MKKQQYLYRFGCAMVAALMSVQSAGIQAAQSEEAVTMFRLYNPNSGEHFYTSNSEEKSHLISVGWTYEGTGWTAPASGDPVFRLYNPNAGDHHYTLKAEEKNHLLKVGWRDEGIGWYSADSSGLPLYRQYNPNAKAGAHNYTKNKAENDGLVSLGWRTEGIGWYGLKTDSLMDSSRYEVRAVLNDLPAESVPFENLGFFTGKGKDGNLHIYNGQGQEMTPNIPKTDSIRDNTSTLIFYRTPEDWLDFEYLSGISQTSRQYGGVGGAPAAHMAYDVQNQKVIFNSGLKKVPGNPGYFDRIPLLDQNGNFIPDGSPAPQMMCWILSKEDEEKSIKAAQNGDYSPLPASTPHYLWNGWTQTVSGPYVSERPIIYGYSDISIYVNVSHFTYFDSIYAERQSNGLWKAGYHTSRSLNSYDLARAVDVNTVLAWKDGIAYLIDSDVNSVTELGKNIQFSTKISPENGLFLVLTDDGTWQIRKIR